MAIVLIFLGLYFIIIASIIAGIVLLVVGLASKEKKNGCIIAGCIIFGCAFILYFQQQQCLLEHYQINCNYF